MSTPTASWETPALLTALSRQGWGVLDGNPNKGTRAILRALVDLTDHKTGTGHITQSQIADVSGYSIRSVRTAIQVLEDLGIIRYARGWLDTGRPRPGFVWISKRALARLARLARGWLAERRAKRAADLTKRIENTLDWSSQVALPRGTVTQPRKRKPLSVRAEMNAALILTGEPHPSTRAGGDPRPVDNSPKEPPAMVWQPPIIDPSDEELHEQLTAEGTIALQESHVPTFRQPKGRCGICFEEWDRHVARQTKIPVHLRHPWENR